MHFRVDSVRRRFRRARRQQEWHLSEVRNPALAAAKTRLNSHVPECADSQIGSHDKLKEIIGNLLEVSQNKCVKLGQVFQEAGSALEAQANYAAALKSLNSLKTPVLTKMVSLLNLEI